KPRNSPRVHGQRRRRAFGPILPKFRADAASRSNSGLLLYGVAKLRALPLRYLQTMAKLRAPFFLVQQRVVPQKHRVYAGRGRREAFEVVRRLPRSSSAL